MEIAQIKDKFKQFSFTGLVSKIVGKRFSLRNCSKKSRKTKRESLEKGKQNKEKRILFSKIIGLQPTAQFFSCE